MKAEHTPGPWACSINDIGWSVTGPEIEWPYPDRVAQKIVAIIQTGDRGNYYHYTRAMAEANGALIAAAPDLLAMLETVAAQDQAYFGFLTRQGRDRLDAINLLIAKAKGTRAAIAKAKGES